MTISKDDEREARAWIGYCAESSDKRVAQHAHTILALLDAPRMPRPEDVPPEAIGEMCVAYTDSAVASHSGMRRALRALYDHYTAPPKVKEWWAVEWPNGVRTLFSDLHEAHKSSARHGGRIVRMVEDRDDE